MKRNDDGRLLSLLAYTLLDMEPHVVAHLQVLEPALGRLLAWK